jgi:CheY-like chemotaxis protein
VQLSRYLPEVLELMRSVLGSRVALSVKVAPDTAPILVDVGELELALINLALNARDAMPQGGELLLAARNATNQDREDFGKMEAAGSGPHVLITVQDDGVGIAPELIDRVFEPFFTTKAFGQGSGLGLSQVHGFSTQAGGAVRLASTPGIGTTVLMLLPVAVKATASSAEPDRTSTAAMTGVHLLLVDDNEALADVTAVLLREHGALVQRAKDASEALRLVAAAQPRFDVVLTDVVMPGEMDGLGLAQTLRRQDPDLPVVLISGYSPSASAEGFPFLRKPCPPDDMLAVLGRAVARQAARRSLPRPAPAA